MANKPITVPGIVPYLNSESPVKATDISEPDRITVYFRSGKATKYVYTDASAGKHNVRLMRSLALNGFGLASFIHHYVKMAYESKS